MNWPLVITSFGCYFLGVGMDRLFYTKGEWPWFYLAGGILVVFIGSFLHATGG